MNNKNYVVVGGSHGIGLALVQRLVASGGQVTVLARTNEQLSSFSEVAFVPLDVTTDDLSADQLPESIDGLAYCPGSISLGPIRGLKPEAMLADYQLNVIGFVKTIQAALKPLKAAPHSSVVCFSTVAVGQGLPMHASVSASKGAVEGLSRAMAAELAPSVRVNCIAPSLTDTPLASRLLSSDEKREAMGKRHPLGRVGVADDIAAMAEFLLTDVSSWITGQVLSVDGGMSSLRV